MRNLGGDLDLPCPFSWLRNGGPLRGQRGSDHSEQSRDLSVGFLLLGQPARISLVQQSPQDTGLHLAHAWLMPGSRDPDLDLPKSLPGGSHSQGWVEDGCGDQ